MTHSQRITVAVLLVVAIGLAYVLWQRVTPPAAAPQGNQQQQQQNTAAVPGIFDMPKADAPEEQRLRYFEFIRDQARDEDVVVIENCNSILPVVTRLTLGQNVTLRNTDSVEHSLQFDSERIYAVAAGSSRDIKADFGNGHGTYSYHCDGSERPAGIFLVQPAS